MYTFDNLQAQFGSVLLWFERITVAFFALDYVLRLFTACSESMRTTIPFTLSRRLFTKNVPSLFPPSSSF